MLTAESPAAFSDPAESSSYCLSSLVMAALQRWFFLWELLQYKADKPWVKLDQSDFFSWGFEILMEWCGDWRREESLEENPDIAAL